MSVFCGQCPLEFEDDTAYQAHVCEVSGVTPLEPEFMGVNWNTIQTNAVERGNDETTKKKVDDAKKAINYRLKLEKSKVKPKLTDAEKLELNAVEGEIV